MTDPAANGLARPLVAEFVGTALLLVAIVGSGFASTDGAASSLLFQHAVVVGGALAVLIATFGPTSGAHFNPVVTLVDAAFGGLQVRAAAAYVAVQFAGAVVGVLLTNLLFAAPLVATATTRRVGGDLVGSEVLSTFGLLLVIFGIVRAGNTGFVPAAVGAYIAAAIYFTPSAAFANPAVTVARMLSDGYTGIAPGGVAPYVAAQVIGAALAAGLIAWLFHPDAGDASRVVVPHERA